MKLIDDIKLGYKCEEMLVRAGEYKTKSQTDGAYYMAFITQVRTYEIMKEKINFEPIKDMLGALEIKILGEGNILSVRTKARENETTPK